MNKNIELRISEEDVSSEEEDSSSPRRHVRGFSTKHHRHSHPKECDSSTWVGDEDDDTQPGIITRSKNAPVKSISLPAFYDKSIKIPDYDMSKTSTSINGSHRASTTEERRNPFAPREGNTFMWQGINLTLVSSYCITREPADM